MLMSTLNQPEVFVAMIYVGFLGGVLFDLCQAIRYVLKKRFFRECIDFIFWLGFVVLVVKELLDKNYGKMQFYCAVGLGIGVLLYYLTVSKIVFQLFYSIARTVRRVVDFIFAPVVKLRKTIRFYRACPELLKDHFRKGIGRVTAKLKRE